LTEDLSAAQKQDIVSKACLTATITLGVFAVFGQWIFAGFGFTIPAFKIAGGALLFGVALEMLNGERSRSRLTPQEREETLQREEVSVVPLGIPLLAGPGAITTVMIYMTAPVSDPTDKLFVFAHPRRRPVGLRPPPQCGSDLPQDRADRHPGHRPRDGPPARRDRGAIPDRRHRGRRPDEGPHPIARSDGWQRAIRRDSKYAQRTRATMPPFEEQLLRKILPSAEEDRRIQGVVRDVMKTLEGKIAAKGLRAKPLLVDS